MSKVDIIVLVSVFALVAIRLYKKYFKKNNPVQGTNATSDGAIPSSSKDDEYEPYSKK
jgi:Tfp pilus assembly major pilin PilA